MKVKKLHLQNYGRFDNLTMQFASNDEIKGNVTIIVGNNGAGKSQILQALATGFSWFVGGIKNKSDGFEIDKKFIKNGFNDNCVNMCVDFNEFNYRNPLPFDDTEKKETNWQFVAIKDGRNSVFKNQKQELDEVIDNYRKNLTKNTLLSLPLIVYYPIERSIIGNSQADILSSEFDQLDAYFACTDGAGIDFYDFFKWFKYQEDLENELFVRIASFDSDINFYNNNKNELFITKNKRDELVVALNELRETLNDEQITYFKNKITALEKKITEWEEYLREKENLFDSVANLSQSFKNNNVALSKLHYLRIAIELFTDFKNIRIERQGTPKMVIEKDGEKLDVNQLSQGEKSLLALVGDIARRLAILNPSLDNPLHGEGVVLIDEIDLHLHPKWQQNLIDKLIKTFPNVQFILTTHSPHIVSDNPDALVYILDNGELRQYCNGYGEDANTLLNGVFGVSERTPEIAEKFDEIGDCISSNQLDKAKELIDELSKILSKNHTQLLSIQLAWAKAKVAQSKSV